MFPSKTTKNTIITVPPNRSISVFWAIDYSENPEKLLTPDPPKQIVSAELTRSKRAGSVLYYAEGVGSHHLRSPFQRIPISFVDMPPILLKLKIN